MKKVLALFITAVLVFTLVACSSEKKSEEVEKAEETKAVEESGSQTEQEEPTEDSETLNDGGWVVFEQHVSAKLPKEVYSAIEDVTTADEGTDYSAVAFLGTSSNTTPVYAVLCQEKNPDGLSYKVIVVKDNVRDTATLLNCAPFYINDYTQGEGTMSSDALQVPAKDDVVGWDLPKPYDKLYEKAVKKEKENLEAISLLGTKEENGTDYAFICYNTVDNVIQVVTVHEAMNGNTEIQNICTIDTALFMK